MIQADDVQRLVPFLDRIKKKADECAINPWGLVPEDTYAWIKGQIRLCRQDFSYLAGNYIYLRQTKQSKRMLMDLNDSQELVLDIILSEWKKGKAAWIMLHKARQVGACLDSKTRVLTSDLRWVTIGEIEVGQELVSVDEFPPDNPNSNRKFARRMRPCLVQARHDVFDYAIRLTMDNGESVTATPDHKFLFRRRGGVEPMWRTVREARVGDLLRTITKTWDSTCSYEDGWFGGLIDGEGSMRQKDRAGTEVTISQVFGPVYDRAKHYLSSREYSWRLDVDHRDPVDSTKLGDQPVARLIVGRMNELFPLIGQTRPSRFTGYHWWDGKELPGKRGNGDKSGQGSGDAWAKVVSIELLEQRRMIDLQTLTKTYIAEGFVSHNSTLWQALFAWKTVFFRQQVGMIIAHSSEHATYTFQQVQYMVFNLPWWMQPHLASLETKTSLNFDQGIDGSRPGLSNFLLANGCNKMSAFGQGKPIHNCGITEASHFKPLGKAREIIEGDLKSAVVYRPGCFWIMESKPAGIGGYWYNLWKHYSEQGNRAQFIPLFIPVFLEKNRQVKAPIGFRPNKSEVEMRERYSQEWGICKKCGKLVCKNNQDDAPCLSCGSKLSAPVMLTDNQLAWYRWRLSQVKSAGDKQSLKLFYQEMAWTAEMGFQAHGLMVLPDDVYAYAQETCIAPKFVGEYLDDMQFHSKVARCPVCKEDHENDDRFKLWVWEHPTPGARYFISADVAYGGDDGDFSVIEVTRCGKGMTSPDVQVAEWSGKISASELARVIFILGKAYNMARVAIEAHGIGDVTQYELMRMGYNSIWQWKHYDTVKFQSNKLGWWTNYQSKQRLIAHFIRWMRQRILKVYSTRILHEMPTFTKDFEEDLTGAAVRGAHDDHLMAMMINCFCAHDEDWDAEKGRIVIPGLREGNPTNMGPGPKVWTWTCQCGVVGHTNDPRVAVCDKCGLFAKDVPITKDRRDGMKIDLPDFGVPAAGSKGSAEQLVASYMNW